MPEQKIKATLAELHEELAGMDNLDPALRELLEQVDGEIHDLLNDESPAPQQTSAIRKRVEALGARFAAEHPASERFFQELVATLGRIGV
jgi:predicted component of type VI protein secretion system